MMLQPETYQRVNSRNGGAQSGGAFPLAAIPAIASGVHLLRELKPISRLDDKFGLSRIPILGTLISGAKQMGFGEQVGLMPSPADTYHPASGVYISKWEDQHVGPRFTPIAMQVPPQSGRTSVPTSSGGRKKKGGARKTDAEIGALAGKRIKDLADTYKIGDLEKSLDEALALKDIGAAEAASKALLGQLGKLQLEETSRGIDREDRLANAFKDVHSQRFPSGNAYSAELDKYGIDRADVGLGRKKRKGGKKKGKKGKK